jgi:hypothetical protein
MGINGPWKSLAVSLGESVSDIEYRLNKQYARRNRIAHEGDCSRQQRRRHIWYEPIERAEVDSEIVWTRGFLSAADKL